MEETLKKQFNLLIERSQKEKDNLVLCSLTQAIVSLATLLQNLSDGGVVGFPVQAQLSMQDLTEIYRERQESRRKFLSELQTRLNQD